MDGLLELDLSVLVDKALGALLPSRDLHVKTLSVIDEEAGRQLDPAARAFISCFEEPRGLLPASFVHEPSSQLERV
jgi:hypothetical protein